MSKFCTECGQEMKVTQRVCNQCGHMEESVDNKERIAEYTHKAIKVGGECLPKLKEHIKKVDYEGSKEGLKDIHKNINKKFIIIGASILGGCVLLLGGRGVVQRMNTPNRLIEQFEVAVSQKNINKLVGIIKSEDKRLEINEENINVLVSYFEEVPSSLNVVVEDLQSQGNDLLSQKKEYSRYEKVLNLKEEEGFISKYYISIKPAFFKVSSKIGDTEIEISEGIEIVKLDSDKEKEIGPIMPGIYTIKSSYKDDINELVQEDTINLFKAEQSNEQLSLRVFENARGVSVYSDYKDAEIFINDKSTGKTLEEISHFSPVNESTNIYGIISRDGQVFKSNEVNIGTSSSINLEFSEYEEYVEEKAKEEAFLKIDIEEELNSLMNKYVPKFADAVNAGRFSVVEEFLYPSSKLYNEQKKNIPSMNERGIRERFIECEVLNYEYNEELNEGKITVKEVYEIIRLKENTQKEMTYNNIYDFKYNEGKNSFQLTDLQIQ